MKRTGRIAMALAAAVMAGCGGWLWHTRYLSTQVYYETPAALAHGHRPIVPPCTVAVLFSGDMGLRTGMGPKMIARLTADGVPVLGASSLAEFRRRHTPDETRAFVAATVRRALAFAHADRAILIGQSFGADMLQVGATGLPKDLRARVPLVALVVPGDTVIFRASPAELLDWVAPDASALPTARQLTWAPAICIHGQDETNSLCPRLDLPNMRRVGLPGGHSLRHDPDALYAVLRGFIAANITKSSESGKLRESEARAGDGADRTGG